MFHRRHMPIYLLIGWGAMDLVLWLVVEQSTGGRLNELQFLRLLLLWGQFIAVSGWMAIGDRHLEASFAGILVAPALFGLSFGVRGEIWAAFFLFAMLAGHLGIYGGCLNLPLLMARARGWRLRFYAAAHSNGRPAYQFSIREIMSYTGLVAGVAAAWGWSLRAIPANNPPWNDEFVRLALVAALLAFPIPWSIWAAFGGARPLHGVLIALLAACFWGAICTRLSGDPSVMLFVLVPSAVLIVHVTLLQAAGFRLGKGEPQTPTLPDRGPDWENADLWKKYGKPGSKKSVGQA